MWTDGNTNPLQGNKFRLFRSVLMGIPPGCDDNIKHRNTHPLLLPKAEAKGVISKQDRAVLKRAIGSDDIQDNKRDVNCKLILPPVNIITKQRSVLNDNTYGSGNRPHWALSKT